MNVSDIVKFRNDLFFGGAVQLDWFEDNLHKAELAAQNFVFHGPEYHGVNTNDSKRGYKLTDTATFTEEILTNILDPNKDQGISLAIAGYGTGKSHLGLTLATLLASRNIECKKKIVQNISYADSTISENIENKIEGISKPYIIFSLNGMKNFNLASELSRQALNYLKQNDQCTQSLEDLWPRFKLAIDFVNRNFEVRDGIFRESFNIDISIDDIISKLTNHDEDTYEIINRIYFQIVGSYINAMGQESPQDLFRVLTDVYCGKEGYFQGILVIFDEFGRYLEFAASKPQLAGDAAIQQLFEAIQNNLDKSFLLCLNQYELKTYLSRIASDLQITLQRYITRFDSAKKYYLSSNLETLFAHLIEKKEKKELESYISQPIFNKIFKRKRSLIADGFNIESSGSTWKDEILYKKIIVQGCWPLDPLATWMLSNLNDILQNRSTISIIKSVLENISFDIDLDNLETISAVSVANYGLVDEFVANEQNGFAGSDAELYSIIYEKHNHSLDQNSLDVLLAILLVNKLKAYFSSEDLVQEFISSLSNLELSVVEDIISHFINELGLLEWNNSQKKYEYILDAVPRSRFISFLDRQTRGITLDQISNIFVSNAKEWSRISQVKSSFSNIKGISTTEWEFNTKVTNLNYLENDIRNSYTEWQLSNAPDQKRGSVIYCYLSEQSDEDNAQKVLKTIVSNTCKENNIEAFPFYIVPIFDIKGDYSNSLSEYFALTGTIDSIQKNTFSHFIEDHKSFLKDEIPRLFDDLRKSGLKHCIFHNSVSSDMCEISPRLIPTQLFKNIYNATLSFNFDGFSTTRGNAAKDCREIAVSLISGQVNSAWLNTSKTQLKNRFSTLLVNGDDCWKAVNERGDIRLYPGYLELRNIIEELEKQLDGNNEVHLDKFVYTLIKPPYGLNIASISIVLGLFISARIDSVSLILDNQVVSNSIWCESAFKSNFLDLSVLQRTKLKTIDENDLNIWKKLLEKWGNTENYFDKIDFEDDSNKLESQLGIPPETIYNKRELLIERNEKIKVRIAKNQSLLNKIENDYAISQEKNKVKRLVFSLDSANRVVNEMNREIQLWGEDSLQPFYLFIEKGILLLKDIFPIWLNDLYVGNSSQLNEFEHKQKDIIKILKSFKLNNLALSLEKKLAYLTVDLNKQKKMSLLIDSVKSFQNLHYLTERTSFEDIENIIKKTNIFITDLTEKSKTDSNQVIQNRIESLTHDFLVKGKLLKEKHVVKLSKYYDKVSFNTIEELNESYDELTQLKTIFIGKDSDLEDINSMLCQIRLLIKYTEYIVQYRLIIPFDQIIKNLKVFETEYIEKVDPDSEIIWEFKDTITPIFEKIKKEVCDKSSDWIMENSIVHDLIATLSIDECRESLRRFSNLPSFLTKEDQKIAYTITRKLSERFSSFKVDGVVAMFDELESEQKIKCMEILRNREINA